jgi:hypothetical protein
MYTPNRGIHIKYTLLINIYCSERTILVMADSWESKEVRSSSYLIVSAIQIHCVPQKQAERGCSCLESRCQTLLEGGTKRDRKEERADQEVIRAREKGTAA